MRPEDPANDDRAKCKAHDVWIGINQGDVVVDDAPVYGDSVNIAAPLEGAAEPSGTCVSGKVHDEVRGKIEADWEDIGLQTLKTLLSRSVFRITSAMRAGPVLAPRSPLPCPTNRRSRFYPSRTSAATLSKILQ
jgi:class 3 adenylate cyclase